jgi:hypothetical protein
MMNHILTIVLAASVATCPFVCLGGDDCCADASPAIAQVCCDECHDQPPAGADEHGSRPVGEPGSPRSSCQCVCGGAVMERTGLADLQLDAHDWVAIFPANDVISQVIASQPAVVSWRHLPDDGANLGRALRCRMMSLLC